MKFASIKCEKKKDILNTMINQIYLSNFDLYCELYLHNNLPYFIFIFH